MKRLRTLLTAVTMTVTAAVLALQLLAGTQVSAATYGDVTVNELPTPQPKYRTHGYVELRYTLFNDSSNTHTVRLVAPASRWGSIGDVSRSVTLMPNARGTVSLWLPALDMDGQGTRVFIDGRPQQDVLGTTIPSTSYYYSGHSLQSGVLFSQGIDSRFRDELTAIKLKASGSSSSGDEFGQRTTLPVGQWSQSWLGYSAFDGLVMTTREWQSMPAQVRDAISAWVEVGGSVLVVGDFNLPARWEKQKDQWRPSSVKTLESVRIGLGVVGRIDADAVLGWSEMDALTANRILWGTLGSQTQVMNIAAANSSFSVTDALGIPARGMLAIMLIFAILIGPVNMYVCAKYDKRLWTLVTIPAAALIFSVSVFAYTMVADGISASGRAKSLTYLDQDNHRAVTLGWLGYYAPLQPSGGLHFDLDTELTAQIGDSHSYHSHQENTPRYVDWSNDQHLTSGWVSSRVPSHFAVRKSQSRRERLEVTQDERGQVTVVNGLGSDILRLHLADAQGRVHQASGVVEAGQKVTLQLGTQRAGGATLSMSSWRTTPTDLDVNDPVRVLKPNEYVAVLKDAVFVEPGLSRLKSWRTEATVIGSFTANSQEQ